MQQEQRESSWRPFGSGEYSTTPDRSIGFVITARIAHFTHQQEDAIARQSCGQRLAGSPFRRWIRSDERRLSDLRGWGNGL